MNNADLMQQIVILEEKIENLERRNRMLGIELDCQKCSKNFTPDEVAEILRVTWMICSKPVSTS